MAREAVRPQRETTAEEWQRMREILGNALELSAARRSVYLDHACQNDSHLRQRLDELIAAYDATGAVGLHVPAFSVTSSDFSGEVRPSIVGRRIGAYRIEAEIAHGGMGTVFRAVRADDEYRKQVAIKLVSGAAFSNHAAELFRRERQVLASLEHSNIARLLDGGTTEDGSPFLVMEYVEGEPVTSYCESHHLTIEERLRLFQKMCSAVQYAHQNLVIHRDLKPANILVTKEGEPKLLDFGVAKIIDLDASPNVTATAWQALTPAYASPEQILGEPITTASDVYSLGLVLCELLGGRPAFSASASSPLQLQRAVLEQDPEPPSRAVLYLKTAECDQISSQLKGDLDSIVAKAIRKNRTERYSSVEQFSDDIRRHLANLPVLAQPDSIRYRAVKFVGRHKIGMLAGGLILTSLLVGMLLTAYEARVARVERLHAERRFNDVRRLANSLLFDLHDAIQDLPGSTPARKLIVEKSLQYLDSLSSESGGDPGLLRELATAYERVGDLQGHYLADNLGENSKSLASYQKALKIRQQLGERQDSGKQDRLNLAENYRSLASQMFAMGDRKGALVDAGKATEISESLEKADPNDMNVLYELGFDYELAGTIQSGLFFAGLSDSAAARESYRKALAVDEKMIRIDPNSLAAQRSLANDTMSIGNAQPSLEEALASYRQGLAMFISIGQRSNTIKDRRHIAVTYNQIADTYGDAGNWKLSLHNHEKGLEIYKELVSEDPKNALLRQGLAIAYVNTGEAKSKLNRLAEGRADMDLGLTIMKAVAGSDANSQQRGILAQMYMSLADNFERAHQFSEAMREYRNALQVFEGMHLAGTQVSMAICKVRIADAERRAGDLYDAAQDFQQALALAVTGINAKDQDALLATAEADAGLGAIEAAKAAQGSLDEREDHWENAVRWYRESRAITGQLPALVLKESPTYRASEVLAALRRAEAKTRVE